MIPKLLSSVLIAFLYLNTSFSLLAQDNRLVIHLFWASGCPHCAQEKTFLEKLIKQYPEIQIKDYEITANRENLELLENTGKKLSVDVSGVPFTVIGEKYFSGFYTEETTGREIETTIKCLLENGCDDVVDQLRNSQKSSQLPHSNSTIEHLKIPFLGNLNIKNLPLPLLTFIIAFLDGFNPCAMWTLLFLISLLLGMKDKKRMWILGIAFIVTSSFVYFLFLSAWLNFFLFLGFVIWVRIAIGLVALTSGGYYLRDYFVNKNGGCQVMGNEKRQKIFAKIKSITQKKQFIFALTGIILLAFAVNLVELICSAGLPAIYTQILSLSRLPRWQYYLYIVFYILIFMLDDLFIFFTAMLTLKAVGIQSKYSQLSHLIGGLLVLLIGVLLLFKPELLMFG